MIDNNEEEKLKIEYLPGILVLLAILVVCGGVWYGVARFAGMTSGHFILP